MTNLIPIISPHLLLRSIDADHFYAVNCAFPNSLRLLNQTQHRILAAIDNQTSITALGDQLAVETDVLERFLELLSRTEIVRFDSQFSKPQKPNSPKSLSLWVHTTNKCNLSCGYCYISTLNQTGGMEDATKKQLLDKMLLTVTNRKIKHIKLRLAGGEPLSQFRAWQAFIVKAKQVLPELDCALDFSFITNLTILTDEILQFAKEHSIGFGVSLDGLETDHNASRTFKSGKGSFSVVEANIHKLLAHQIPVSINTVVSNANLTGLPNLTRYLIDLDVPFRYSIVKGETIDAELLERCLTESYAIMAEAVQKGWQFSNRHQFCDLKPNELGFQTCASGFSGGAIYVDGTVNYCHVHFGDQGELAHSLFDDDMDLVDMIEQGSHHEDIKSKDCQSCRYKSVCTSGCPVYRVNGKDPQCSLYHKFIPMIYDLQARERLKLLQNSMMM